MAGLSDVRALTISDENAADADRLVTTARPNTGATMANTTFAGGAARNVTVTTAGTGDNGKTNTIVGTDVFGNALTEVITSTGSAEAVAGESLFLTVTSVTSSAQFAGNITVGSGSLCAQAVESSNRVRIKGMSVVSGGTAGDVEFINGTPESGTTLFKSRTIGTANTTIDRSIPSEGVLFENGGCVKYTVDVADNITIFYA
ncbi:hypothetical protein N9869_01655 [Algibacter sp.]|nr:hypothetical protein [Algibacter sp.]MDB4274008.1 hypothetical protein [Algibacter sp.]